MRKGERVRKTVRLNSVEMTGHVTEELKDLLFTWGSIEYVSLLIETRDILQGKRRRCNAISCFFLLGLVKGLLLLLFIYSLPRLSSQNIYVKWQGSFPCRLVAFSFPSDRHKNRSNSCNVLCICRVLLATWVEKEELGRTSIQFGEPPNSCVFYSNIPDCGPNHVGWCTKVSRPASPHWQIINHVKLLAAC